MGQTEHFTPVGGYLASSTKITRSPFHQLHKYKSKYKQYDLTYILGSRALNGIVFVADRKYTEDAGEHFTYDDKLYEVIKGVVIGFSGNRGAFELFKTHLHVSLNDNPEVTQGGKINIDKLLLLISETMSKVNSKRKPYDEDFDVLVAISNPDGKGLLKHFYPDGRFETIDMVTAIGTGKPYGLLFLNALWFSIREMREVAELGLFHN